MSGPYSEAPAKGPPLYPKRDLFIEPFAHQLDMVEKALIEVQNQPSLYINGNRGKKKSSFGKAPAQVSKNIVYGAQAFQNVQPFVPKAYEYDHKQATTSDADFRTRLGSVDGYSVSAKGTPLLGEPVMSGSNSSSTTIGSNNSGDGIAITSSGVTKNTSLGLFDPFKPFEAASYSDPPVFNSSGPLEIGTKLFGELTVPTSIWGATASSRKLGDTTVWG